MNYKILLLLQFLFFSCSSTNSQVDVKADALTFLAIIERVSEKNLENNPDILKLKTHIKAYSKEEVKRLSDIIKCSFRYNKLINSDACDLFKVALNDERFVGGNDQITSCEADFYQLNFEEEAKLFKKRKRDLVSDLLNKINSLTQLEELFHIIKQYNFLFDDYDLYCQNLYFKLFDVKMT